ncbi:hypothetical protein F7984_12515 [Pradoshia sp. D12]|uniref:hypothetical protein n=1 Tax=Bacillaceae TaxID=186817 RepID=UPI001111C62F|nr:MULTISPECIES: hypothetical protein [Bacillaceae]QFK71991.1 hypothetical protein F7984_12515 [Pradoshia sp. D12]TPF71517.1 hypothetical protein FHY44_13685 [Bacillus sp. D12]
MKYLKIITYELFVFLVFYLLFLHIRIAQIPNQTVPDNADYLIILGARVIGTDPSPLLQERINTAAAYLEDNPFSRYCY